MQRIATRWRYMMACLGLLALSLTIAGPLLSQTQRLLETGHAAHGASHHGGHSAAFYASRDTAHQAHGAAHSDSHRHAQLGKTHDHHDTLAACDYCTFFLHIPGAVVREANVPARPSSSRPPLISGTWRPSAGEHYPRYHGRAPPLRSV